MGILKITLEHDKFHKYTLHTNMNDDRVETLFEAIASSLHINGISKGMVLVHTNPDIMPDQMIFRPDFYDEDKKWIPIYAKIFAHDKQKVDD